MQEIEQHNFEGLCSEQFCNNKQTHFIQLEVNSFKLIVGLCEKHSLDFENKLLGVREND